ncbi:MAG: DUF1071 domain-containing protein [Clostridiales bacterium]|nr:DUF1071 domain-containing protein [Clostridiales bacterium]
METKDISVFKTLNTINVNGHTEKKKTGNTELTYLSWSWAWAEVKKQFEDVSFEIKMFDGLPYIYDPNTGYMVFTSVTIDGQTHDMWLPVMDGANKAMKVEPYQYKVKNPNFKYARKDPEDGLMKDRYGNVQEEFLIKTCEAASMMDINKTIMRCLVKNLAMFGLGLYIYAGEDLPEGDDQKSIVEKPDFNGDPQEYYQDEESKAAQKAEQVGKQKIGDDRAKSLTSELIKNGADPIKVCQWLGIKRIADITEGQQVSIIKQMDKVVAQCPYEKKEG